MAVAGDEKHQLSALDLPLKAGGPQTQDGPQLAALHRHPAHGEGGHAAGTVRDGVFQPCLHTAGEVRLGVGGQEFRPELLRRELRAAVIIGDRIRRLGGLHRLQIGQVVEPHLPCRPGQSRRGGVEHRQDGAPAVQDGLSVGLPDRRFDLGLVIIRAVSPVAPGPLLADVGLAAGGVRADVGGVPVVAAGLDFI